MPRNSTWTQLLETLAMPQEHTVIANVGNRDLAVLVPSSDGTAPGWYRPTPQGHPAEGGVNGEARLAAWLGCSPGARPIGAALLQRLDHESMAHQLRVPILEPALKLIIGDLPAGTTLRVLLVASDQTDGTADRFRDRDTFTVAEVIRRVLQARLESAKIGRVDLVVHRLPVNPSDIEQTDPAYEGLLEGLQDKDEAPTRLHVVVAGGTPQMNQSLRGAALGTYGPRVHLIRVDEPAGGPLGAGQPGVARRVNTLRPRLMEFRRVARVLLDQSEYRAAFSWLEDNFADEERQGPCARLQAILAHLAHRAAGDYRKAQLAAAAADLMTVEARTALADADHPHRLRDAVELAKVAVKRQDSLGYLTRIGTLAELLARRQLQVLGVPHEKKKEGLKADELPDEIRDKLKNVFEGRQSLITNFPIRLRLIDALLPAPPRLPNGKSVVTLLRSLKDLTNERNRLVHDGASIPFASVEQLVKRCTREETLRLPDSFAEAWDSLAGASRPPGVTTFSECREATRQELNALIQGLGMVVETPAKTSRK